jgi:hypothetical protein
MGSRTADRLDYVAAMLKLDRVHEIRPLTMLSIEWRNGTDYREEVGNSRRQIADGYNSLLIRLVATGWLTEEERTRLPLQLVVTVTDDRSDRSQELPPLD